MPAGSSYHLRNRSGARQRCVNLIPVPVEAANEPNRSAFKDFPGLVEFAALDGAIRGAYVSNGRAFIAYGAKVAELHESGAVNDLATIPGDGFADFAANASQVCVTAGGIMYVIDKSSLAVSPCGGYPGGSRIDVLNEFLFGIDPTSGRVWWSNVGEAETIDGLSYATAESSPDNLTACIVSNEELLLIGRSTIEPWRVIGGDDVITKTGRVIEVGSVSPHTIRRLDNSVFFVGSSDEYGQGVVYRLNGYTPQRVSTRSVEESLTGLDITKAYAFTFMLEGDSFYFLQVPGLTTTWVFNLLSGMWFEVADFTDGEFIRHRADVHLFAFGKSLVGGADGKLYELSPFASSNAGDHLVRSFSPPAYGAANGRMLRHSRASVACDTGQGGSMLVRWSDDNGNTMEDWETVPLGEVGNFSHEVALYGLGAAYQRVYEFRVTDNVPWNPSRFDVSAK